MGPRYPTVAANVNPGFPSQGDWTNVNNVFVADGVYADGDISSGGKSTGNLQTSGYGFNLPPTAIVDGIYVEFLRTGFQAATAGVSLGGPNGGGGKGGTDGWPGTAAWIGYGGPTDLWGNTWSYTDINDSSFGVSIQAYNTHGGGNAEIDAVRITVYWHTAPIVIPRTKYYLYKVYDSTTGAYLGNLPNVSSEFAFSQDMNTAGSQITVDCGISADVSNLPVDVLTDEAGNILTDESSSTLTNEGVDPQTGIGTSGALIRDGNTVKVWEFGYYHPNGICMFSGVIERHEDNFGGDGPDDNVRLLIYSDASDMDNHLVRGFPYVYTGDVSQLTQNSAATLSYYFGLGVNWNFYGQSWKVGAGVTNLAAIALLLAGSANVTISVYTDSTLATLLGSVTQSVATPGGSPAVVQLNFALPIQVVAGSTLFFAVTLPENQALTIYYQNTAVYANGTMYNSNFTGTSGGNYYPQTGSLYFETFSGSGSTEATYTAVDPTSDMMTSIVRSYNSEGGLVQIANIQATGLSLNYGFNTSTVYEALQGSLTVCPNGFYYYVDLGYDLLYLQKANTAADIVLTKGVHISQLKVVSTIEYIINACYVIGASIAGSNIYTLDEDRESIDLYGLRLQVHSDSNIPDATTAHVVGSNVVDSNKDEQYQTSVTIPDNTMDTTLLIPGKIIGFNGFGSYVDDLLAQIVHRDYAAGQVTLTLGILPKRTSVAVETVVRGLTALNTVSNPTSPS